MIEAIRKGQCAFTNTFKQNRRSTRVDKPCADKKRSKKLNDPPTILREKRVAENSCRNKKLVKSEKSKNNKMSNLNRINLKFDKSIQMTEGAECEKFLVMKSTKENEDLEELNPFLLKKCVDSVAQGEVKSCKKLRNGTVLILTFNSLQAKHLIQLTQLNDEFPVNVSEHNSLNQSKGVVSVRDFKFMSDEQILLEMKSQYVTAIHRIKIRFGDKTGQDSGTYFLTFNQPTPPESIRSGYDSIPVRPFIPEPLRCFKCLRFGHTKFRCDDKENENGICGNCAAPQHVNRAEKERCKENPKCVNCGSVEHGSFDKKCNVYQKEKEIVAIKMNEKCDYDEARRRYLQRNPLAYQQRYANVVQNVRPSNCKCKCSCKASKPPEEVAGFSGWVNNKKNQDLLSKPPDGKQTKTDNWNDIEIVSSTSSEEESTETSVDQTAQNISPKKKNSKKRGNAASKGEKSPEKSPPKKAQKH